MGAQRLTQIGIVALCALVSAGCDSGSIGESDNGTGGVSSTGGIGGSAGSAQSTGGSAGGASGNVGSGGSSGGGARSGRGNGGSATGGASAGTGGSGGSVGSGGAAGSGTGGAGTGGAPGTGGKPGVHVTRDCPSAAQGGPGAVGVWQNITPKEVCLTCLQSQNGNDNFGTAAILVNPLDPAQLYLGTEEWGVFKSMDCGTTWSKINTGKNGDALDKGSQWTMILDPTDPQVLYTNSGFGVSGIFKSVNGGVDWEQVLSGNAADIAPYGGFMGTYNMDPGDHLHITASFHAECMAPMNAACFIETKDGGKTWVARNGDPSWSGGEHTILEFLDSTHWLFGNQDGMWTSTDSGTTWKQLPGKHSIEHHQQLYRAAPGVYFQSSLEGLIYSNDNGATWTLLDNSPLAAVGVVGTGKTVYTAKAGPWKAPGVDPEKPYYSVSQANPTAKPMDLVDTPAMVDGALFMDYDPDHHIVYSSNFAAGVWRAVVNP